MLKHVQGITEALKKWQFVTDIRGGVFFDDLFESLVYLKNNDFKYEILFLEASNEVLVKRFKEARRTHPLSPKSRVLTGMNKKREIN